MGSLWFAGSMVSPVSTELALWGIETTTMVPGAFTQGTNHFAHAGTPSDETRVAEYEADPYAGIADYALRGLAWLEPEDADPAEVAREIVRVVDTPFGKRPFRVHVDPSQDGEKSSTPSLTVCAGKCTAISVLKTCSAPAFVND
jgi:hypothetical protein